MRAIEFFGWRFQNRNPRVEANGCFVLTRQKIVQAAKCAESTGITAMQGASIAVERVSQPLQFGSAALPIGSACVGDELQTAIKLSDDVSLSGFVGMEFQAK